MADYCLQKEFKHFCQKNDVSKQSAGGKKQRKTNDNTAESYSAVYLPALSEWIKKDISDTTFIEKNFLDIIPFLLSQGKFEECDRVLLRLHRIITLNTLDKTERNRRASFNKYCLFIQTKYIDKRKTCSYSGAPYDLDNIASELDNLIVFYYLKHKSIIRTNGLKLSLKNKTQFNLWKIFDSRLRSQNRTSGDKTWLSLDLISSINSKILSDYIDKINASTIVYYVNQNNVVSDLECENIWCLILKREKNNAKYSVYVTPKDDNNTYPVLTPTAIVSEKKSMLIEGIDKIAIDHVNAIDLSLRKLTFKNAIPFLVECSDKFKVAKRKFQQNHKNKPSDSEIVKEAKKNITVDSANLKKLRNEMSLLLKDSWYRLMDSYENSLKSNNAEFLEYRTGIANNYIGIIMNDVINSSGEKCVVYHDFSKKGNYVAGQEKILAEYSNLVDLTSFGSCGKAIL